MLFIVEKFISTGADVPNVGLYWLTGSFWWTDGDAGTKPFKPAMSRLKRDVWYAYDSAP